MHVGELLPAGALITADENRINLSDFLGHPLVLYFYPKADTPGCTTEGKDFSELMPQFNELGVRVIGVSKDTPQKLRKFAEKQGLIVTLASDAEGNYTESFGAWGEKSLYGRTYMGIERCTFLFDSNGRLVREWRKVRVKGHALAVFAAAQSL